MIEDRYFLDQDGDGHWFLVNASRRKEWEEWKKIPSDDERAWEPPDFAVGIDSPNEIVFYGPIKKGRS